MTIKELAKEYELTQEDYWQHKQSGKWILKHSAVEKIMVIEEIHIIDWFTENSEMDLVRYRFRMGMRDGEGIKRIVESIGEADRKNCISLYLGCMAEKRGIDRCVLKLINAYQYDISSEVEADDYKQQENTKPLPKPDVQIQVEKKPTQTSDNEFRCPNCESGIFDNRVKDKDGNFTINAKNHPAFKCKNKLCGEATWETDPLVAGVMPLETPPHQRTEDERHYEEVMAENMQKTEDLPQ